MVTREDQIEQSVMNFIRAGLVAKGYDASHVAIRDAFPTPEERESKLEKTTVAAGFNFDDGGRHIELGSELTERVYTLEFWTFGLTPAYGRNVANVIRYLVEQGGYVIPLQAVEQSGQPVIGQLLVQETRGVSVTRQIANAPRPWDRYVFTTTMKIEDTYFPSQALVTEP